MGGIEVSDVKVLEICTGLAPRKIPLVQFSYSVVSDSLQPHGL